MVSFNHEGRSACGEDSGSYPKKTGALVEKLKNSFLIHYLKKPIRKSTVSKWLAEYEGIRNSRSIFLASV
jgi:hypothetical protein